MKDQAHFLCAPGYEALAAELADLVNGSWEPVVWVRDVMVMANGATVPRELPERASAAASGWWSTAVTARLAAPAGGAR